MENKSQKQSIIKLQKYLITAIVIIFSISIIIYFFDYKAGVIASYISVVLLFMAAPIRMIQVGEYFRKTNQKKYTALSYIVIGLIALTVMIKLLMWNA